MDVALHAAVGAVLRELRLFALVAVALVLGACGGGGGDGGGGSQLSLSPSNISVSMPPGLQASFVVEGTVDRDIEGSITLLVTDNAGVILPGISVNQVGPRTYRATLTVSPSLAVGTYTGTLVVQLCGSTSLPCSPQYARANLPYEFQVGTDPNPVISSLNPTERNSGSAGFELTVIGSNFWPSSVITWNGVPRATTFVSVAVLRTQVNAAELMDGGIVQVGVSTPDGGASATLPFTLLSPVPQLTALGPTLSSAGCSNFNITVRGSDFRPSSTIYWDDTPLQSFYLAQSRLLAIVPAAQVTEPGTALITVRTPAPGGGDTLARSFTVTEAGASSSAAVAWRSDPGHTGTATVQCPSTIPAGPTWSTALGGSPSYALAAEGKAFMTVTSGGESSIVALNLQNGQVAWGPFPVGQRANAAYDDGKVFVAVGRDPLLLRGALQAYDAATGELLWREPLADSLLREVSAPTAVGGRVFVNFDAISGVGERIGAWSQADGAEIWTSVAPSDRSPPAVGAVGVYIGRGCVTQGYALEDGELLWSRNAGCTAPVNNVVTVVDGRVYSGAAAPGGSTPIYDELTGEPLGGYLGGQEITVSGETGYVASMVTGLQAINLATGAVEWQNPFGLNQGVDYLPPIVAGGVAWMVFSSGTVWGLDPGNGEIVWQLQVPSTVINSPFGGNQSGLAVGGGMLLIPGGSGVVAYRVGNP